MSALKTICDRIRKIPLPLITAVFCAAAAVLGFAVAGVYPFGRNTVVTGDLYSQYMPFIVYLKRFFSGRGSLLYTAEAGLGEAMLPTFAYYLSSPLNLLVILFPISVLTEYFFVIIVVKVALSGASTAFALKRITGAGNAACFTGAVMYALSMYVTAYSWNIMWLDVIAVMPLVINALNDMLEKKGSRNYILLTALSLYLNFYLSYMVLVFVFMWFLMKCISDRTPVKAALRALGSLFLKTCLSFALVSWLIIPTALHLSATPAGGDTWQGAGMNSHFLTEFTRMLFGVQPAVLNENLVNLYSGLMSMICLVLFFRLKSIPLRVKTAVFSALVFIILSFSLRDVMLFWNFFHYPVGLPYRNAFIFVFLNVILVCLCLDRIREFTYGDVLLSCGAAALYILWADATFETELSFTSVYVSLALVAVYAMLISGGLNRRYVCALMMLCMTVEIVVSCAFTRLNMQGSGYFTVRSSYIEDDYHALMSDAVKYVRSRDTEGFYRMQDSESFTNMDGMFYGFNCTSVFSSTHYRNTVESMRNLGMSAGSNSQFETCFMPVLDSFLGVRYYMTPGNIAEGRPALTFFSSVLDGENRVNIYRNDCALPPAFACSREIRTYSGVKYDPVTCQNDLMTAMTGNGALILKANPVSPDPSSLMQTYDVDTGVSFTLPGGNAEHTTGTLNCRIDYPGQVYVYVDCIDCDSILVNSEGRTFMPAPGEAGFTDLGYLEKGSKVEVTINAGQGGVTGNVYVATLDEDVFEKDFMLLKKGGLHGMEWTGTSLSGTADVPEDSTMLTTFSYDRGWTVFVDGVKTPAYSVDSSFLAFDVGSGNHRIEMYYVPAGFRPGLMLTLLSVLGCCAWMYRKKKSEVKRAAGVGSGAPDTGENGEQEKEDP